MAQQQRTKLVSMRMQVQSLALLSGLRIRPYSELWCRSYVLLGSHVAAVMVYVGSSNSTPSPGTSICSRFSCKKKNKTKRKPEFPLWHSGNESN